MCGITEIVNTEPKTELFSDDEIENIIIGVFAGTISVRNLDLRTYMKVSKYLADGMFKGYGKTLFDVEYASTDWTMLTALRENIYVFSAAKQYQQVRAMSALMTTPGGVRDFNDFKKQAKQIFVDYNESYLRAEYNSAIAQARSASMWKQISKDMELSPMLTYHTVGDSRVRPTHAELDGISRPVGDKFWDSYFPPNGWNCRCTTLQSDDAAKTDLRGFKKPDDVPDIFMFNAGKEKIIFSHKHPYFDIAPRDKWFAKMNFDLPLPNQTS